MAPAKANAALANTAYYNIDFSLQNQLRLATAAASAAAAAASAAEPPSTLSKQSSFDAGGSNTSLDKDSVRKRGRRGRHQQQQEPQQADQDQAKILKVGSLRRHTHRRYCLPSLDLT